jgi:hypothetical protein
MNLLGKFRSREMASISRRETDRMRGSETKSFKTFDLVNGFEQLHERGLVADFGNSWRP